MLRLLDRDVSGKVPCPHVQNLTIERLRGVQTSGGYSLQGKFPALVLRATNSYEAPAGLVDYFTAGPLQIVSGKLRAVLESVDAEFEYFPVTLHYSGKETQGRYFVANAIKRIKGIDLSMSIVEIDDEIGDAQSVTKLVLDTSRFIGTRVAVVDEIQRIAFAPEVVCAIEGAGCTGCIFVEASTVKY